MSTASRTRQIVTTGLAMFSMFFGAGNIVFPLAIGQYTGDMVWWSLAGLLISAVGIPFLGLISMIYYNGDYKDFFSRIGTVPGYLATLFIMVIIAPVNAIPRCISLSYSTMKLYCHGLDIFWFSVISCLIIFMATVRKSRIVDLLGEILSPLLVASLGVIIIKGLLHHPAAPVVALGGGECFLFGLHEGYKTMDLFGTFFFSGITIASLRHNFPQERDMKVLAAFAVQASLIGAGLLGLVYVGFSTVAAYYGGVLTALRPEVLLGMIAHLILGSAGGFFVSMAVALACLTTAVTLAAVFAEYLQRQAGFYHLGYTYCLVLTLIASCAFANLGFEEIVGMVAPVLVVGYPVLLVLVVVNMLHKMYGFQPVKTPVLVASIISIMYYYGDVVGRCLGLTF